VLEQSEFLHVPLPYGLAIHHFMNGRGAQVLAPSMHGRDCPRAVVKVLAWPRLLHTSALYHPHKVFNRKLRGHDASGHGWRAAERAIRVAEVVVSVVQAIAASQFSRFAESVIQPRPILSDRVGF
jgi:hypothetical protein